MPWPDQTLKRFPLAVLVFILSSATRLISSVSVRPLKNISSVVGIQKYDACWNRPNPEPSNTETSSCSRSHEHKNLTNSPVLVCVELITFFFLNKLRTTETEGGTFRNRNCCWADRCPFCVWMSEYNKLKSDVFYQNFLWICWFILFFYQQRPLLARVEITEHIFWVYRTQNTDLWTCLCSSPTADWIWLQINGLIYCTGVSHQCDEASRFLVVFSVCDRI